MHRQRDVTRQTADSKETDNRRGCPVVSENNVGLPPRQVLRLRLHTQSHHASAPQQNTIAPKGQRSIAQGNALGIRTQPRMAP